MNEIPTENEEEASFPLDEKTIKKKRILKLIGIISFVVINAVVLYFTAMSDFSKEAPEFDNPINRGNVLYLIGAVGCIVVMIGVESGKFLLMMRKLKQKVSFRDAFEVMVLGKYYDYITPSGAGGQPFQIYYMHQKGYTDGTSSAMPLCSFVILQFGFLILAAVVIILNHGVTDLVGIKIAAYLGILAYIAVPVLIIITAISPKATSKIAGFLVKIAAKIKFIKKPEEKIAKMEKSIQSYSASLKVMGKSPGLLLELLVLSMIYHVALCSVPYFVIHVFGGNLGFFQSLSMSMYMQASICIIPTPGNAGAAEGSFYLLFSQLETSNLFWAMVIWRFLIFYMFLILGVGIYGFKAWERGRERLRRKKAWKEKRLLK